MLKWLRRDASLFGLTLVLAGVAACGRGQGGGGSGSGSSSPFALRVAVGALETCATTASGIPKCWGYNADGQLGDGTTTNRTSPNTVTGLSDVIEIASGRGGSGGVGASCAILQGGQTKCWGINDEGQLGDGTQTNSLAPVTVSGVSTANQVMVGQGFACALLSDSTIKCWGNNGLGQLGNGGAGARSLTPVTVSGISNAVSIGAGSLHACALLSDKTVKCWGYNGEGQLGNGNNTSQNSPVTVSGLTGVESISVGERHVCAIVAGNALKCWGKNDVKQLWDGSTTHRNTPVSPAGVSSVSQVSSGSSRTCVIYIGGTVGCWGDNSSGLLGDGAGPTPGSPALVGVSGIGNAKAIHAGRGYSCAVLSDDTVKCWGDNTFGQLGDGTTTSRSTPVLVTGFP